MKKIIAILPILALFVASNASAHVSVSPKEVGVGKYQTYSVSVPSEKDISTTGLRLVIPAGLESVSPTVKPGWTINTVTGENDAITEIRWTGGNIPGHFRDDFTFSAKAPAKETTLYWKAYQTYRDGTVVAWELLPTQEQPKGADGAPDFSASGPASSTAIINDLKPAANTENPTQTAAKNTDALVISMIAVVVSVFAVYMAKRA